MSRFGLSDNVGLPLLHVLPLGHVPLVRKARAACLPTDVGR